MIDGDMTEELARYATHPSRCIRDMHAAYLIKSEECLRQTARIKDLAAKIRAFAMGQDAESESDVIESDVIKLNAALARIQRPMATCMELMSLMRKFDGRPDLRAGYDSNYREDEECGPLPLAEGWNEVLLGIEGRFRRKRRWS